jgi:hypothetical protein
MDRFSSNQLLLHEDFYLNSFSLIDSTILYDENNDITMTEKYVYNSGKQLILQKEYVYQDGSVLDNITEFEYGSDGTLVKQSDNYSVITYDYYDLENNLTSFTPFTFQSPKLVKTTTDIRGGVTTIVNHTYTFDNQKRLTSETITQPGTENTVINSYTY